MRAFPKVQYFNDFTGGLNNKSARQSLLPNESPDCQDVVFNARGGFSSRPGVAYSDELYWSPSTDSGVIVCGSAFNGSTEYMFGLTGQGRVWEWDGSSAPYRSTSTTTEASMFSARPNHALWKEHIYFADWVDSTSNVLKMVKYQVGTHSLSVLTNTANNNYTLPTGGNAPLARHVANHSGHMWWADTTEGGTRFPSRVRFSHPLQPEDFADADYFDIFPEGEGNPITALVSFQDMLLVFKRKGVFAIYGYDRSTFVVQQLSTVAGTPSHYAVDSNSGVCYWWSNDGNVYAFNGRGVVPVGERISGVVNEKKIVDLNDWYTNTYVVWSGSQLLVSLALNNEDHMCFMYDPAIGKTGAWTKYSLKITSMMFWRSTDVDSRGVYMTLGDGVNGYNTGLYNMIDPDVATDEFDSGVFTAIPAYYKMAWFVGQDSATSKRWRRPRITVASTNTGDMSLGIYYDFNESSAHKTMVLPVTIETTGGSMVWDDGTGTVGSDWDAAAWAGNADDPSFEFLKGASIGRSHAILLKFQMPNHGYRWWVDSFSVPYVDKSYR